MTTSNELALESPGKASSPGRLDIIGAALSFLCLAHCAIFPLLPFILAGLPWLENEALHMGLLIAITPVAIFAFLKGFAQHRQKQVLILGFLGLVLLLMGPFSGEALEKPLTVIGSITLFGAHILNRKKANNG